MAKKKSVDIVIPIYNEELELEENISKLHHFLKKNFQSYNWRIIIADNASTDSSLEIAKRLSHKLIGVSFIHLKEKGRGRAVKRVWKSSKADYCSYMDVDLSTDLKGLKPLLKSLENGYDIAIGSRIIAGSEVIGRPLKREVLSRIYNILIKIFFQTSFSDAQCGFKAITGKSIDQLLPKIKDDAWFFDSELLIVGEKLGFKIYEVPVKWIDNPGSTVRVLHTVKGDLLGLWRLFGSQPWKN